MSDLRIFNQTITNSRTKAYIESVLGEKAASFTGNVVAVVANDAKLQTCEPMTLLYGAVKATTLDLPLDPNFGYVHLIPYKNNREGKTEAQFQLGYKAFVQLAMRSKQYKYINVRDVREGDNIDDDFLRGNIIWDIKYGAGREGKPIIGYVAYFELLNGFRKEVYWTVEQVRKHGLRYSQTFSSKSDYVRNSSRWVTDFDDMAKKSVLKNLLSKWGILSIEMQQAIKYDQSVIVDEQGTPKYVDNLPKPSATEQAAEFVEAEEVKETAENANGAAPAETLFE